MATNKNWKQNIEVWESQIRSGSGEGVKKELLKLTYSKIPREFAAQISNFFYRLNSANEALKILNPIIRPANSFNKIATEIEMTEYAVALLRVGAVKEANKLLSAKKMEALPETFLFRAYALMATWSYKKASLYLKKYITKNKDDYKNLIAKVNLLACLVNFRDFEETHKLSKEIITKLEADKNFLLLGNVHELVAQSYYYENDNKSTLYHLAKAEEYLKESNTIGKFFVRKWHTFLKVKESSDHNEIKLLLDKIREEAHKIGHFESVRSADYAQVKVSQTEEVFNFLIFGTPYKELKQEILSFAKEKSFVPKTYLLTTSTSLSDDFIFNLKRGETISGSIQLKSCQVHHRLLMILAEDFYRPKSTGQLFGELFPDEYFNPSTSLDRVHKSIARFRKWSKEVNEPFLIHEDDGDYKLEVRKSFGLEVELNHRHYTIDQVHYARLKSRWPKETFTRKQGASALGITSETFVNTIKQSIQKSKVFSSGKGANQVFTCSLATYKKLS